MINIVLATNNLDKIKEYEELFEGYEVKLYLIKDLNIISDPNENGKTYNENSLIKAKAIIDKTSYYILADDSGVEFEALGEHFPGVHTHRYALINGGNEKLNPELVKKIGGSKGTFYCAITLITPEKEIKEFLGKVTGTVSKKVEGSNGFGYDPIFIIDGNEHTNAYYPANIKNKMSHRAKAMEQVIDYLKEIKAI